MDNLKVIGQIDKAIAVMKRASSLHMKEFQSQKEGQFKPSDWEVVKTEIELHRCGNRACFAGYIAVSPEFQEDGGSIDHYGSPVYNGFDDSNAIADWLGISFGGAHDLVFGDLDDHNMSYSNYYDKEWEEVTKEDVIRKLQELRRSYEPEEDLSERQQDCVAS